MSDDSTNDVPRWQSMSPFPGNLDTPGPSVCLHAEFGARSRRGVLRPVNDDHYLVLQLGRHQQTLMTSLPATEIPARFDEFAYGLVVADGMGHAAESASRLAISSLAHLAVGYGRWNVRINEPIAEEVIDRAARFFKNLDATLVDAGSGNPSGLQTTLTAVYAAGNELFFAYVGDSRAYMFRDNTLMQLTRDHSLDVERISPAAALDAVAGGPQLQYLVTDTLGSARASGPRVDIERCGLLNGDLILLCTNGLTDAVDDARIADMLRLHRSADDQCQALVDLAARSKAYDDVTVVIARCHIRPRADIAEPEF